jgi:hypothetical protein
MKLEKKQLKKLLELTCQTRDLSHETMINK